MMHEKTKKHLPGVEQQLVVVKELSKRLLSVEETAAYLGISARTIYNQIGRKSKKKFPLKPKRLGRLVRFDRFEVDRYIESL